MRIGDRIRGLTLQHLTGQPSASLKAGAVATATHLEGVDSLGLYLHLPFCRQICPYCPYNKELFRSQVANRYTQAVLEEIDRVADVVGDRPITSLYVGGGTPTTMLGFGLDRILERISTSFSMLGGIHMESHPNDLSTTNLRAIAAMGVEHLSIGIEALQDHHLQTLRRPYTARTAIEAIQRALEIGFACVNVDLMFALPNQTRSEIREAVTTLARLGLGQITTYPLFSFRYTGWPELARQNRYRTYSLLEKRRMLRVVEQTLYPAGYERSSVWAFTRSGVPRYCSVTVPLYIGLGPSAGTYLPDIFYLNTFSVSEYIAAVEAGRSPIALSLPLARRRQMAGWLYWRVYETRVSRSAFFERFGEPFVYERLMWPLARLGLVTDDGDLITLTDQGAYWLHALQDLFSIDYVSKLWGTAQEDPWPDEVVLQPGGKEDGSVLRVGV